MQSSSRLVGFILYALGFGDAADANRCFAFRSRHPEKVSQQVEVGRDRQGFELGGHVGDVAGDVEHFPRHSPMRRIVGSSRRARGSTLSAAPTSGFVSQEAYFLGHPIKLSHLPLGAGPSPLPGGYAGEEELTLFECIMRRGRSEIANRGFQNLK